MKKRAPTEFFHTFAKEASNWVGSHWAFIFAIFIVIVWGATGPLFDYSDTWQLVINTGTTIITFLMVFLIQNSQNRDAKAIHLKLDELIHSIKGARDSLIDLENCADEELEKLQAQFETLRHARHHARGTNRGERGRPASEKANGKRDEDKGSAERRSDKIPT